MRSGRSARTPASPSQAAAAALPIGPVGQAAAARACVCNGSKASANRRARVSASVNDRSEVRLGAGRARPNRWMKTKRLRKAPRARRSRIDGSSQHLQCRLAGRGADNQGATRPRRRTRGRSAGDSPLRNGARGGAPRRDAPTQRRRPSTSARVAQNRTTPHPAGGARHDTPRHPCRLDRHYQFGSPAHSHTASLALSFQPSPTYL